MADPGAVSKGFVLQIFGHCGRVGLSEDVRKTAATVSVRLGTRANTLRAKWTRQR